MCFGICLLRDFWIVVLCLCLFWILLSCTLIVEFLFDYLYVDVISCMILFGVCVGVIIAGFIVLF